MFFKRYRFALLTIMALALWLTSMAYRNRDNLQVRRLSWTNDGAHCIVECEIWNPQKMPVTAKALIRLVSYSDEHSALSPSIGSYYEFTYPISANSHIDITESIPRTGPGQPEVRAIVVPSSKAIASRVAMPE